MDYFEKAREAVKGSKAESVPGLITELLDAASKIHILHLIVRGNSSYAQHKALNKLYDALPDLADAVAESWQGATGEIPNYIFVAAPELNSVEDCLRYIPSLRDKITAIQKTVKYSEINNDLDTIKTALNSAFYKLKFLG
jgi:DNA-binding ferritin-like protein